jgi:hypothetical protein
MGSLGFSIRFWHGPKKVKPEKTAETTLEALRGVWARNCGNIVNYEWASTAQEWAGTRPPDWTPCAPWSSTAEDPPLHPRGALPGDGPVEGGAVERARRYPRPVAREEVTHPQAALRQLPL